MDIKGDTAFYEQIGKNLKKVRKSLIISGVAMAQQIGCSKSMVSRIEHGEVFGKSFLKYLFFLLEKGVNLNEIFKVDSNEKR